MNKEEASQRRSATVCDRTWVFIKQRKIVASQRAPFIHVSIFLICSDFLGQEWSRERGGEEKERVKFSERKNGLSFTVWLRSMDISSSYRLHRRCEPTSCDAQIRPSNNMKWSQCSSVMGITSVTPNIFISLSPPTGALYLVVFNGRNLRKIDASLPWRVCVSCERDVKDW